MALPKVELSRGGNGRSRSHLVLGLVDLQRCPQCRKPCRPHRVCPDCGAAHEVIKTD